MAKRKNEFYKVEDLISNMLVENNLQKGMDQLDVKEAWLNAMGPGVVSYTESVYLKQNTLIVKLSSSTLREELSYGKDKIVKMLNKMLRKNLINKLKLI